MAVAGEREGGKRSNPQTPITDCSAVLPARDDYRLSRLRIGTRNTQPRRSQARPGRGSHSAPTAEKGRRAAATCMPPQATFALWARLGQCDALARARPGELDDGRADKGVAGKCGQGWGALLCSASLLDPGRDRHNTFWCVWEREQWKTGCEGFTLLRTYFYPILTQNGFLVDPASSDMLVSRIKPCMRECNLVTG